MNPQQTCCDRGATAAPWRFLNALAAATLVGIPSAHAHDLQVGDVVVGVANGSYQFYTNNGTFIKTVSDGFGGFTTGAYFLKDDQNPPGRLYTTNFSNSIVVVYDGAAPNPVIQTVNTAANGGGACESVLFNTAGEFFVGHVGGDQDIKKYDAAGNFVLTYNCLSRSDWIDLATDQCTMFYNDEGRVIRRFDVCNNLQLADFVTLPGSGAAFALRLLPPFDGSGGMIVADLGDIKRLNSAGTVIQNYDVGGEDAWFSMNLDPNGTSFWAGDFGTSNFYRFNIATGAVEVGPINTNTGGSTLFGIAVVGEISGGVNNPPIFESPSPCNQSFDVGVGIPFSYSVNVSDPDAGDSILLTATGVPPGASHNPGLPLQGGPDQDLTTTFNWTPGNNQVGVFVIEYTATDDDGAATTCRVTLNVAECHLATADGPGADILFKGGHAFQTQLRNIRASYPVLLDDIPVFEVPRYSGSWKATSFGSSNNFVVDEFTAQVVMYNPEIFRNNPEQSTPGVTVRIWANGAVTAERYGQRDGMDILLETFTGSDGKRYYRFPFRIDGM